MRQQLLADILRELNKAWERILSGINVLTGANPLRSRIIFVILCIEVLVFALGMPLHRKVLTKLNTAKQELVKNIDEIIYLLAKYQYASRISKRDLGGDPHMAMMTEMFKSGHFEYLDNISLIQENVGKVELLLQKQVVTDEQRTNVHALQKKMKRLIFRKNFLGRIATVSTLGVYKLFR